LFVSGEGKELINDVVFVSELALESTWNAYGSDITQFKDGTSEAAASRRFE
jgi:hypothetical protein